LAPKSALIGDKGNLDHKNTKKSTKDKTFLGFRSLLTIFFAVFVFFFVFLWLKMAFRNAKHKAPVPP